MAGKRPNILLTITDDQRHSAMSCCEGPTADAVRTPHLDALAARGVHFTRAYHAGSSCGAVCSPSRAMLHTGCGPFDIPAGMVKHPMGPEQDGEPGAPTLGQLLGDHGYVRHMVGKWHNDDESFRRSFDAAACIYRGGMADHFDMPYQSFDGQELRSYRCAGAHSTDVFTSAARQFLRSYAEGAHGDRPFFLYVAFTAPHDPRRTHAAWHERYPASRIELPPNALDEHPFDNGQLDIRDELLTSLPRDPAQTRHELADYYAMTQHMDNGLGRIHGLLEELGLADDTLVVHTADHGLAVGQHGLMGKQNMYDHSVRVPLLLAGPDIAAGQVRNALCYQHDLFPTLLAAAGIETPSRCAFKSLWPCVNDARHRLRDGIGSRYTDLQRMWTDGHNKVIVYTRPNGERLYQRFNIGDDPWECHLSPVSESEAAAGGLLEGLDGWQREMGDPRRG